GNSQLTTPAVAEGDIAEGDIAEGDIVEGDIADGDIAEGDIADGDIAEGDIADGDIAEGDIAEGDIAEGDIADGDIAEGDIASAVDTNFSTSNLGNTPGSFNLRLFKKGSLQACQPGCSLTNSCVPGCLKFQLIVRKRSRRPRVGTGPNACKLLASFQNV